jgi:hypothetical protein
MTTTERMNAAKKRYSEACALVLKGDPDAARLCDEALAELKRARLALIRDAGQRLKAKALRG